MPRRLSAVKLAGDPNNPVRIPDNATIEKQRAEVMKHLERLAPVLDLEALMAPADGIASRDMPQVERSTTLGRHRSKRPAARHGDHHGGIGCRRD